MTYNKKAFEEFKERFSEELEKIKRSNYNKYLQLLYLIEKYDGLILFKLPVEDCAPQDRMYPELQYLFLDLNTAFKNENFIDKVDILCSRLSEGITNNLILLNNPRFHDYKVDDLKLFKNVFKKLVEVYSEKYGIEVILIDLEEFYEK